MMDAIVTKRRAIRLLKEGDPILYVNADVGRFYSEAVGVVDKVVKHESSNGGQTFVPGYAVGHSYDVHLKDGIVLHYYSRKFAKLVVTS